MRTDLVLLHAPSVYDFREKTVLYGPVSDLIPPSPVFEMYPIGLTSIAEYLEKAGYRVRIVNLAVRMMRDPAFDAEEFIRGLESPVFGIDLHWMVHSHGSIEIAKLVRKHHPGSKVVFGGFSSTYFYKELIKLPEIDYIIRGDTTEEPFRQLMDCITKRKDTATVPNLVWKDDRGKPVRNPFTHSPSDIDNVMDKHYDGVINSVIRHRDLASLIPFKDWLRYPITAVITCRGCTHSCTICGGSAYAFKHMHHRNSPAVRSPERVAANVKQISHFSRGPIFVLGDLCQFGEDYAEQVLFELRKAHVGNQLIFELFSPVSKKLLQLMALASPNFCLEISPESHDPEIKKLIGRNYSNEGLEQTMQDALEVGCGRLDVYYMTGLPKQNVASVMESVDYCDHLMNRFNGDKRLALFIAPISPFLDPGSLGFEEPEKFGYKVLFRSLEEHRQALVSPSWKHSLNYETDAMTRDEIAESGYESILRLIRLKEKYGIVSGDLAATGIKRLEDGREMMHRIEKLIAKGDYERELAALKPEIDALNNFPVSETIQLELPVSLLRFRALRWIWYKITGL